MAPASAERSTTESTCSGRSSRKGSTGMRSTPQKSPAPASFRMASSRRAGEGARGSTLAASSSSTVVTVILQITGEWA